MVFYAGLDTHQAPPAPFPHDADAIAKQMRIEVVPELVDVPPSETLKEVGEYRLPLKLIMPSGQRAGLDVTVAST